MESTVTRGGRDVEGPQRYSALSCRIPCFFLQCSCDAGLAWCRIVGLGPGAEDSLGSLGLAVYLLVVSVVSGLVTSTGIFFAYIVTREEYLLTLVRGGRWFRGGVIAAIPSLRERACALGWRFC